MPFYKLFQYQVKTQPVETPIPPAVPEDAPAQTVAFFKKVQFQALAIPVFTQVEDITLDKWYEPLAEPVRRLFSVALVAASGLAPLPPNPVVPSPDAWAGQFTEPVRQRSGLGAHLQQPFTVDPAPVAPAVPDFGWFAQLSEPTIKLKTAPTPQPHAPFVESAEVITVDKWFSPLQEPSRKSIRPDVAQPYVPFVEQAAPGAGNAVISAVLVDVPREYRLQYQGQASPVFTPAPEVVTLDKWYAPWREPVRQKPGLATDKQMFTTNISSFPRPADVVSVTTLSSPLIYKQRLIYQSTVQTVFFVAETVTLDKWYAPWREPVRQKPGLLAAIQRSFTTDPYPIAVVVPDNSWFSPLSTPVRSRPGLHPAQQQSFTTDPRPVVVVAPDNSWYAALSEPVRLKKGLRSSLQPYYTNDTQPIPTSKGIGWFEPLSEPYPYKRGLKTHLQQFFTTDPSWIPNPSRFLSGWFNWLGEPRRFPKGLMAWLQQAAIGTQVPPGTTPDVTITISAIETNSDILSAALIMSEPSARALVSIREIPVPQNDYTSIREISGSGSLVSIKET